MTELRIVNSGIQDVECCVPEVARRGELLFNGYRFSVLQDEKRSMAGWW